jgi:hypothetical protein
MTGGLISVTELEEGRSSSLKANRTEYICALLFSERKNDHTFTNSEK